MQPHWEQVYRSKSEQQVSWYCPHLDTSLALIEAATPSLDAPILDIGGGASTLVDDLLQRGFQSISVLDIAQAALDAARTRLGPHAAAVQWICSDILTAPLPAAAFHIWHDRAVFHFLTDPSDRRAYTTALSRALAPSGHAILATFGPEGPLKCSGLDVVRYDAAALQAELGPAFHLNESRLETHLTPWGAPQQFLYCHFTRAGLSAHSPTETGHAADAAQHRHLDPNLGS